MMLGISLTQTLWLECSVCGQVHDQETDGDRVISILKGHTKYALCPCCLQSVEKDTWTTAYKRRWTRYVNKHFKGQGTG